VVAAWPRCVGECWRISDEEIREWLAGVEHDTALTETTAQTQSRQEQTRVRETKLKGFAEMFKQRTLKTS